MIALLSNGISSSRSVIIFICCMYFTLGRSVLLSRAMADKVNTAVIPGNYAISSMITKRNFLRNNLIGHFLIFLQQMICSCTQQAYCYIMGARGVGGTISPSFLSATYFSSTLGATPVPPTSRRHT